jgi:hypothetical protein
MAGLIDVAMTQQLRLSPCSRETGRQRVSVMIFVSDVY